MVNYFFLENRMVKMASGDSSAGPNIFWIDLISATDEEKHLVERDFRVELFTQQESEEIESSSKYVETEDEIGINLNFLVPQEGTFINEPVSFILKNKILITQRAQEFRSFSETYRKMRAIKPADGDDMELIVRTLRKAFVVVAEKDPTKLAPIARAFQTAVEATRGPVEAPKEMSLAEQLAEARAARAARTESQGAPA